MERCWKLSSFHASPLHSFALKLKAVKTMLKTWNKEVFGDVFQNIKKAEDRVLAAQYSFDVDPSEDNFLSLEMAQSALSKMYLKEENFWRQKARIQWLKEGDNNTKFFYTSVMSKSSVISVNCKMSMVYGLMIKIL